MNDLLDIVQNQLGREGVARIGQRLGTSEAATGQAISAALPVLLGALARNAQAPGVRKGQGNQLLNALLDQDGDGDITDDLLGMGGKMLGGLFGRKR